MGSESSMDFLKEEWSRMKEGLRHGPPLVRAFYLLMIYMVVMILTVGFLYDHETVATTMIANILVTIFAIWSVLILALLFWFRILRKEDKWGLLPEDDIYNNRKRE